MHKCGHWFWVKEPSFGGGTAPHGKDRIKMEYAKEAQIYPLQSGISSISLSQTVFFLLKKNRQRIGEKTEKPRHFRRPP